MPQPTRIHRKAVQKNLETRLQRLKRTLKMGNELRVWWAPKSGSNLSGEVKGECIYIYDENEELALETLKHEFVDYSIASAIEPYKEVTNRLIALINDKAYKKKERLVESFCRLIKEEIEQ